MSTTKKVIAAAAGLLMSAASLLGAELTTAQRVRPDQVRQVVQPGTAGCVVLGAPGQLHAPSGARAATLDGTAVGNPADVGAVTAPIVVSVDDAAVSDSSLVAIGSRSGRVFVECQRPTTSTFVQLPDVGSGDIVLVNPDSTDAVVNLTLYGADGQIVESGARGLAVARRSTRVVPMSVLAPAGMVVGAQVDTSQGRVVASARLNATGGGADQAAGQEPGNALVLAGVPAKAAQVRLLISNPGDEHVTATLTVMGERGSFAPVGHETVDIEGQSSTVIDLTSAVAGEPVAIRVTTNRGAVAASLQVKLGTDAALIPASTLDADQDEVLGHSPAGVLHLANPAAEDDAEVSVDGVDVTVPAGAVVLVPVEAGAHTVSGDPVVASVVSDSGLAVARWHPVEQAVVGAVASPDPRLR